MNQMEVKIDVQELLALLGEKDVEAHLLRKQLAEARIELEKLKPKLPELPQSQPSQ